MAGSVQTLKINGCTNFDDIAGIDAAVHIRDPTLRVRVGNNFRAGGGDHCPVTASMVTMLMSIEYLRYRPAIVFRNGQTLRIVEWIDCQRVASFFTGDQVIKVPVGIAGPDLFNDQRNESSSFTVRALSLIATQNFRAKQVFDAVLAA